AVAATSALDGAACRRFRAGDWRWHAAAGVVAARLVTGAIAGAADAGLAGPAGVVAGVLCRGRARLFVRMGQPGVLGATFGGGAQQLDLAAVDAARRFSPGCPAHAGACWPGDVRAGGTCRLVPRAYAARLRFIAPGLAGAARGSGRARRSVLAHLYPWTRPLWPNWIHSLP